jgi:hypothetical protein
MGSDERLGLVAVCGPDVRPLRPGDRVGGVAGQRPRAQADEDRLRAVPPGIGGAGSTLAAL